MFHEKEPHTRDLPVGIVSGDAEDIYPSSGQTVWSNGMTSIPCPSSLARPGPAFSSSSLEEIPSMPMRSDLGKHPPSLSMSETRKLVFERIYQQSWVYCYQKVGLEQTEEGLHA